MRRGLVRAWRRLADRAVPHVGAPARAQVGFDRAGRRLREFRRCDPAIPPSAPRDASAMRAAAPGRSPIPHRKRECRVLAQIPGARHGSRPRAAFRACAEPGLSSRTSGPIEFGIDRFGGDYRNFDRAGRSDRQGLPERLRSRGGLPRLDLCAAGLCRFGRGLLPQEPHHPAAAQAMLHFGRGEVGSRKVDRAGVQIRPIAGLPAKSSTWIAQLGFGGIDDQDRHVLRRRSAALGRRPGAPRLGQLRRRASRSRSPVRS